MGGKYGILIHLRLMKAQAETYHFTLCVFQIISSGIMRVRLLFITTFIMSLKTVLQNIQYMNY